MNEQNGPIRGFRLEHDAWGSLVLVDSDGERHAPVEPVRGFPISAPDRWISICDFQGRELVSVEDAGALAPEVRQVLSNDLTRREFVPLVRRIVNVPADAEQVPWEIETDRGPTRFVLNSGDDVRRLGPHRALIIDAQGIRYLVDDVRQLDPASRRIIERFL
jgi:hypothetical protein